MPVLNGSKVLHSSLDLLANKMGSDHRLHVCDNKSIDNTLSILNSYVPAIIPGLAFSHEGSLGEVRDSLLRTVNSEYVANMDADDYLIGEVWKKQLNFLDSNEQHVAVGSQYIAADALTGEYVGYSSLPCEDSDIFWSFLGERNPVANPNAFYRTQSAVDCGGFHSVVLEDFDFWMRIAQVGKLANLNIVGLQYNVTKGSYTSLHTATGKTRQLQEAVLIKNSTLFNLTNSEMRSILYSRQSQIPLIANFSKRQQKFERQRLGESITAVMALQYRRRNLSFGDRVYLKFILAGLTGT